MTMSRLVWRFGIASGAFRRLLDCGWIHKYPISLDENRVTALRQTNSKIKNAGEES
jgi:hypothetical protein